jgi:hypothetical protein
MFNVSSGDSHSIQAITLDGGEWSAFEKLKRHKSPSIDHIPAKLIQADSKTLHYETHKFVT